MNGEPQVQPIAKSKRKRRKNVPLGDQCDALFGVLIRGPKDNPHACLRCGTRDQIQCAHGFSRSYRATRWDERNAFPLCKGCHVYFTHRPIEWDDWLMSRWGADLYREVRALAVSHRKVDMPALLAELKERVG